MLGKTAIIRGSPLYEAFVLKAKPIVKELIDSLNWNPSKEELTEIQQTLKNQYIQYIENTLKDEVRGSATRDLRDFLKNQLIIDFEIEKFEPIKLPTIKEMANPEFGSTLLEEALLAASLKAEVDPDTPPAMPW